VIDIPGYVIKREIGAGGMASVYLAVQTSLEREVALKVMAPNLAADPVFSKRFLQEARMLASLAHPNIVAVYDVGVTPSQLHYFSMQYLPGGDFASRVERGLDERDLTLTLAGVARALGYAHQRGYVHRDVAPTNILYNVNGNPVLTDFGIALSATPSSRITSSGFSVGTSHFMSPEQARGGDVDARSDIYSLGALCYFGLVGKPPFEGADGFAVAYAHVFEPIPRLPPSKAHWQPLIDRALAKDPKDRYADIDEFLDGIAAVVPHYAALFREDPAALPASVPAAPATTVILPAASRPTAPARAEPATTRLAPRAAATEPAARASASAQPIRMTVSAGRPWLRYWPVLIVCVGVALISFSLLSRVHRAGPSQPSAVETPLPPGPLPATSTSASITPEASVANKPPPTALSAPPTAMDSIEAVEGTVTDPLADLPTVVDPVAEAIRLGRIDLAAQRLTLPPGSNALERFQLALKLDPKNKAAKQGIVEIAKKYIEFAEKNRSAGDLVQFDQYLKRAAEVARSVPDDDTIAKAIAATRRTAAAPYIAQAQTAAQNWDKAAAKTAYEKALALDPDNAVAREGLIYVATIGEPGFVFRDKLADGAGPELVIVDGRVAMARRDVTRAEFRRYWNQAGRAEFAGKEFSCRDRESLFRSSRTRNFENPDIPQDDDHPVVCVTFAEAAAYAQWLSKQTGKRYRLPTPAEFDQVARRAGAGACKANLADRSYQRKYESREGGDCDDGFAATSPVGHFPATAGVFDIDGNVRVWVAACGNGRPGALGDGCRDHLVKGRAWISPPKESVTYADTFGADVALNTVGIRLVRDLDK
jgi:formylglycine-generating enzyme required for sulfatase activity